MSDIAVNQRAQQVLKILVERYIQEGLPIGSKTLAEEYDLGLSAATIRNILADLEEAGLLISPHTSAGRVPTELGYRLFVDSLLTIQPLDGQAVQELKNKLAPDLATPNLIQSAASLLSSITQMMGVVTLPRHNRLELHQVEFVALSGCRVLVILVLNNREIQNRIIHTDRVYTQNELLKASNYLNAHYSGQDLLLVHKALSEAIQHDRNDMRRLLLAAIETESTQDYVINGQNHLLNNASEINFERLKQLFDAITQKQDILNLLDDAIKAEGIQIFIGKETGKQAFDDCSIVTTSYAIGGQVVGTLGVIGPTRMPYDRVISAVDVTAKLLSAALNQS